MILVNSATSIEETGCIGIDSACVSTFIAFEEEEEDLLSGPFL